MLRLPLAHHGHTVIEASNGREGLVLFRHAAAYLVNSDSVMPDVEGIEVLMALRKIALPRDTNRDVRRWPRERGPTICISPPYSAPPLSGTEQL